MYLLDEEISLENINDAIRKINQMMWAGTDEGELIEWIRGRALKMTPFVSYTVEGGNFEGHIFRIYLHLTLAGRRAEEEWPRLVDGLNEIYKYLSLWFSN